MQQEDCMPVGTSFHQLQQLRTMHTLLARVRLRTVLHVARTALQNAASGSIPCALHTSRNESKVVQRCV